MRLRPRLLTLHRDIGFFCVGLTVIYAVSGVAVNHRQHWDYNRSRDTRHFQLGSPSKLLGESGEASQLARQRQDALVDAIARALGRSDRPRKHFWRAPDRLSLFFGRGADDIVDYRPSSGVAQWTRLSNRPLLREFNFLHLNEGGSFWTYVADAYAVLLAFLAISGVLIVRGPKGLRGRGGILLVMGVLVALAGLLLMPPR